MRVLSLFSGIGGLDLAAEAAGMTTVGFCERDPFCQRVLAHHWPGVPIYDDITTLTGEQVLRDCGPVDLIHGGWPCQPHSVAGRRGGAGDVRHLWPEYARLVGELRPRWIVGENVPGILSSADLAGNRGGVWAGVLDDLTALGYHVAWGTWGACDVGAPHRRERVFVVAFSEGGGGNGALLASQREAVPVAVPAGAELGYASGAGREERNAAALAGKPGHAAGERAGGSPVADAAGWRRCGRANNEGQRATGGDGAEGSGAGASMGDPAGGGLRRGEAPGRCGQPARASEGMADPEGQREWTGPGQAGPGRWGRRLGDGHGAGATGTALAGVGFVPPRFSSGLAGRWPAGRGAAQHEWEPARTLGGVKDRAAKLKALGNAVVPAQAYPLFAAIAARERTP